MSLKRTRAVRVAERRDRTTDPVDAEGRPGLGPLPNLIGYVLRRAQVSVFQDFIETCASQDIRPAQYSVLAVIEQNPGLNQSRLARLLGIKRANLVGMLDELEMRGLAERRLRDDDRRAHGLHLTSGGVALMSQLHALVAAHEQRMVARISKRGKDQLILLLRQLYDAEAASADDDADAQ
jgi:DNA-binding MarR family transcriptional regulator